MPTRIDVYQNHAFRAQWDEVLSVINEIEAPLEATADEIQNRARLARAIEYVDKLLATLDKELVPPALWDNCLAPTNQALGQLQANENKPNAGHIDNANVRLDTLIQYISPYALTTDKAADAVGAALSAYSKSIKAHTTALEKATAQTLKKAQAAEKNLEILSVNMEAMDAKIAAFEEGLFTDKEEQLGTKSKVEKLQSDIDLARDVILTYRKELVGDGDDDATSISSQIAEASFGVSKIAQKARLHLTSIDKMEKELIDTHHLVMGRDLDDGTRAQGLKELYDNSLKELEDYD